MSSTSATSRLAGVFAKAKSENRSALIAYIIAGDSNLETTAIVVKELESMGIDLIELGIPYSDPLADGPAIIAGGQRALAAGTTLDDALNLIEGVKTPTIIFSYANPLFQYGIERLAKRLREVSAYGAIIPDLPLEETERIAEIFSRHDLEIPLLAAPTTPPDRLARIVAASGGFLYLVSRLGVTGNATSIGFDDVRRRIEALRKLTDTPIAVGFGLGKPEHIREVADVADGLVIGTALVESYRNLTGRNAAKAVRDFLSPLRAAAAR